MESAGKSRRHFCSILRLATFSGVALPFSMTRFSSSQSPLRHVRDPRRRYQFLLLRRIMFWCVIAVVLAFTFSNELSSVATFAGLTTAGVAVALQNVRL